MELLIGIDGGGTKTDFLVCDSSGIVLKQIRTGPSNPVDIGIEQAIATLNGGLCEIQDSFPDCFIASIYAGLSGGSFGTMKQQINSRLRTLVSPKTIVENDTDGLNPMLYEFAGGDGAAVIAGTGSVGFCKKDGQVLRIGGYGYLFDKGGSGYDYGRDAIYHALCALDGKGEKTLIVKLLEARIGDIRASLPDLYHKGKAYIASFAPIVFEAYRQGDTDCKANRSRQHKGTGLYFPSVGAASGKRCV